MGAASDLEGNYLILGVPPGKYTILVMMMGYSKVTINDVVANAGEVTKIDASLTPEVIEAEEVVVTAKAIRNTEAVLLKDRQKAIAVSDAVSAEAISKAGGGNAADAMKQVTGASVVEGKYVYVRGLGDRYTSIQLNGAELPSVDPYKRAGAIDLIPSNLIDNIVTVKSFTPDKPGDFSGGTVNVETKDFPEDLNISLSTSTSYNSQTTFKDNVLFYEGSSTDWLGFDNGDRAIPSILGADTYTVDAGLAQQDMDVARTVDQITKAFGSNMAPITKKMPVNQNYALSIGNQFTVLNRPLGYLASLTYSRNHSFYDNGQYSNWWLGQSDSVQQDLENVYNLVDTKSTDEVLWGGQLKLSYKLTPKHIISLDGIYNQNGESTARFFDGPYPYDLPPDRNYRVTKLQYKESSLKNLQLNGDHQLIGARVSWKGSYAKVAQNEPDLRFFYSNLSRDRVYRMKSNLPPERYFRFLDEDQWESKLDIAIPFKQWSGIRATFKVGVVYAYKTRDFLERRFTYNNYLSTRITSLNQSHGDINQFFDETNLGMIGTRQTPDGRTFPRIGIYISEENRKSSNYSGDQTIAASYAMFDLPLVKNLRFIGGARYEITDIKVESDNKELPTGTISTTDLLPSVNLIYNLKENMNARFAFTRTLARPTFREISSFQSYDFNGGSKYVGNPELKRTLINNLDLRWEWFSRPGEIYAISAFWKEFKDPIELSIKPEESSDVTNIAYTWKNVDEALTYGLEVEIRKQLDVITSALNGFSIGANVSIIESRVDIDTTELASISGKRLDASDSRPFQGQSPYLVNLTLGYDNLKYGISASVYYNVFGKRLSIVSLSGTPDVYEQPFRLLNVSVSKKLTSQITLKLAGNNLLDDAVKQTQQFKDKEYIFRQYNRGRSFSIGLSYDL